MLQDTSPLAPFASSVCGRVSAWTKKLTRGRQAVRNSAAAAAYSQGGVMAQVTVTKRRPTHLQIANRAFEIYASRGGDHGHDVGDWLPRSDVLSASRIIGRPAQPQERAPRDGQARVHRRAT